MKKTIAIWVLLSAVFLSCVQEEHQKEITFMVDTNGIESINSIGIRGDFLPNKWEETVDLTDENNDGIFEITFTEKTAVNNINFKFVKNDSQFELEGKENRKITFNYNPETIIYKSKFNEETSIEIIKK
ncbi:hypothetical protein [Polaribacter sp.]|uniref:hypothetical protein n=1 Tax=Polaribacter sp. TaxID=1920175 RepID=UPI004048378E